METRGWDDGAAGDVPHAREGDVRRLPLLPGAGPAAAPRRRRRGSRRPGDAAGAAGRAAGALRGARASPRYDAAVLVADPGMTRRVRGDLGRRAGPAGEGGRELRHRRRTRGRRRRRAQRRRAPPARRRRPASRRCSAAIVDGRGLAAGRAASCSSATSRTARRPTSCSPAPGPGPISDDAALLGHVDAVIAANPKAVDGLPGGQARDRVLRRPGDEGDRRARRTRRA